jgi:hypothetical protein
MDNHNIKTLIICLLILLGACSSQSHSTQKENLPTYLTVKSKVHYKNSGLATFEIINNSKQKKVFLKHPEELEIEKKTDEGWKQVETLYCPCGASCPQPPEKKVLPPGKTKSISWNLKRQWCEGTNLHGQIPQTKTKDAGKGTYRFVLRYSLKKNSEIKTSYETFYLERR